MHQENRKSTDDVYENDIITRDKFGKEITNCNVSRNQSSELTGSDGVKITSFRVAAVCLLLLCVLLVIAVIVLCVTFTQERQQLITKITSFTEERHQLNIHELSKFFQAELRWMFTDGWINYQFSLYYVSNETKNWTESRRDCTERGADLVIIKSKEKQDFVNKISCGGDVWIGLIVSNEEGKWKWVDGSAQTSGFWRPGEPNRPLIENCTLNHFGGWADYTCTDRFKWICERKLFK